MSKTQIQAAGRVLSLQPANVLRIQWTAAQKASLMTAKAFRVEVDVLVNIFDDRCADGCCGNEGQRLWAPTPGEWVALAQFIVAQLNARPIRRVGR